MGGKITTGLFQGMGKQEVTSKDIVLMLILIPVGVVLVAWTNG